MSSNYDPHTRPDKANIVTVTKNKTNRLNIFNACMYYYPKGEGTK
jgi:hypothetical protein